MKLNTFVDAMQEIKKNEKTEIRDSGSCNASCDNDDIICILNQMRVIV